MGFWSPNTLEAHDKGLPQQVTVLHFSVSKSYGFLLFRNNRFMLDEVLCVILQNLPYLILGIIYEDPNLDFSIVIPCYFILLFSNKYPGLCGL